MLINNQHNGLKRRFPNLADVRFSNLADVRFPKLADVRFPTLQIHREFFPQFQIRLHLIYPYLL